MISRPLLFIGWLVLAVSILPAQEKGTGMTEHAKGSFEVTLRSLEPYNTEEGAALGRMSIDKIFHGDLEAVAIRITKSLTDFGVMLLPIPSSSE